MPNSIQWSDKKELPISIEEINKKKEFLQQMNVDIGRIIEMTPEVREILGTLYKEDQVFAKKIEILGNNLFKIEFVFPKFESIKIEWDHVSIVQMQLALVQWLFTAIWLAIRQNGVNSPMSYETYLLNRANTLYRRDERTMRKKLKFNEKSYLIFKLQPVIKKWKNIYSIITDIIKDKDTFLDGKVECVLQDQYLFDEREKENCKPIKIDENELKSNITWDLIGRYETSKNLSNTISMADSAPDAEKTE